MAVPHISVLTVPFVQRLPYLLTSRGAHRWFSILNDRNQSITPSIVRKCLVPCSSVVHVKQCSTKAGLFTRLKNFVGFGLLSKSIARVIGYKLYESIDNTVSHEVFFKELNMEDSFHSWFIVRSLHIWMLMARLMNEGENGRLVRNALVEALWEDVDFKSKQIGETASSIRKKQIQMLVDEFQGNLFAYDEGLLSSDQVLAGAVWRNLLLQGNFDPRKLEILVDYIRENISHLDRINPEIIFKEYRVDWIKIRF